MKGKITTFIRETANGHTVSFKIGVQTFPLSECLDFKDSLLEEEDSLEMAQWTKEMLDKAFLRLPGITLDSKKYKG